MIQNPRAEHADGLIRAVNVALPSLITEPNRYRKAKHLAVVQLDRLYAAGA